MTALIGGYPVLREKSDKLSFGYNIRVNTPWFTADSSSANQEIASYYGTPVFIFVSTTADQLSLS